MLPLIQRPRPENEFWGCGVVVINEDNEILMGLRHDNKLWGLPGGKVEVGETPASAACRELREETKLTALGMHFLGHRKEDGKVDYMFVCTAFDGEPVRQVEEVLDLKWIPIDELDQFDIFPCSMKTIEKARNKGFIEK